MEYNFQKLEEALKRGDQKEVTEILKGFIDSKIAKERQGEFYLKFGLALGLVQTELNEQYEKSLQTIIALMKELEEQQQQCEDGEKAIDIKEKIIKDEL